MLARPRRRSRSTRRCGRCRARARSAACRADQGAPDSRRRAQPFALTMWSAWLLGKGRRRGPGGAREGWLAEAKTLESAGEFSLPQYLVRPQPMIIVPRRGVRFDGAVQLVAWWSG